MSHDSACDPLAVSISTPNLSTYEILQQLTMLLSCSRTQNSIIMQHSDRHEQQHRTNFRVQQQMQELQAKFETLLSLRRRTLTEHEDDALTEEDMEMDQVG